uniref:FAR1 domain-containing protein n=1 Tax=Solanum lycopersicum TaxID=4081 RepID=K4D8R2_SOLLC
MTSRKITCYKEGYGGLDKRDMLVKKPRKETRTSCLAHMIISRQSNGKFSVISFEEKHNHPLVHQSLGKASLGFTKRDHKNYLRDKRKESLQYGVARSLVNYFEERYEANFLNAWEEILEKCDLKDNSWLKNTFAIREKWSMSYGRNIFSASMQSTQLSESFNGSLKGYLKSDLDIVQFFKNFQRADDDKRAN